MQPEEPHPQGVEPGCPAVERDRVQRDIEPVVEGHVLFMAGDDGDKINALCGNAVTGQSRQDALMRLCFLRAAIFEKQLCRGKRPKDAGPQGQCLFVHFKVPVQGPEPYRLARFPAAFRKGMISAVANERRGSLHNPSLKCASHSGGR